MGVQGCKPVFTDGGPRISDFTCAQKLPCSVGSAFEVPSALKRVGFKQRHGAFRRIMGRPMAEKKASVSAAVSGRQVLRAQFVGFW